RWVLDARDDKNPAAHAARLAEIAHLLSSVAIGEVSPERLRSANSNQVAQRFGDGMPILFESPDCADHPRGRMRSSAHVRPAAPAVPWTPVLAWAAAIVVLSVVVWL